MSVKRKVTAEPDTRISICRLCALVSGSKSFIPLYVNKEEQDITKEINQLVPNIIASNDGLPQEVCFKCADSVNKCFKFINSVIETQDKLRQMIRLSDAKLKDASPSPNQFLENDDQWSTGADDDYASRTRANGVREKTGRTGRTGQEASASDKIIASKTLPPKKSVDLRVEPSSSAVGRVDANAKDTYMKRLKSCSFKPVPPDAGETNSVPEPRRLFRCGICYEKFDEKDNCLAHIADKHAGVKKPVLPNTIFEAVRKGELDKSAAESASGGGDGGKTPTTKTSSKGVALARPPAKRLANGETELSAYRELSIDDCQSPQPPPKRPGTRGRKVLAIDSFYAEMNQPCTRYICDDCGRMMMSRFAFLRHLHDHREANKSAPVESEEVARPKRLSRGTRFYCNVCKKSVRDGQRHRMYHTIVKLESKFPSSANMLANVASRRY